MSRTTMKQLRESLDMMAKERDALASQVANMALRVPVRCSCLRIVLDDGSPWRGLAGSYSFTANTSGQQLVIQACPTCGKCDGAGAYFTESEGRDERGTEAVG